MISYYRLSSPKPILWFYLIFRKYITIFVWNETINLEFFTWFKYVSSKIYRIWFQQNFSPTLFPRCCFKKHLFVRIHQRKIERKEIHLTKWTGRNHITNCRYHFSIKNKWSFSRMESCLLIFWQFTKVLAVYKYALVTLFTNNSLACSFLRFFSGIVYI